MYMPEADYRQIQAAKTKRNLEDMKDFDKEKHKALSAFAAEKGGLAAEFLQDKVRAVGGVRTQYERVEQVPED